MWFRVVHSNVGGCYANCGLSETTFKWMIEKAATTGLELDKIYLECLKADSCGEVRRSVNGIYLFFAQPYKAINKGFAVRTHPDTGVQTIVEVIRNDKLHYSHFERRYKQTKYSPKNLVEAISSSTPFNHLKDQWQNDWLKYIAGI